MNERRLRFLGPLFLFGFLLVFFYGMFINSLSTAVMGVCISAFYAVLAWESTYQVVIQSRKKWPGIEFTKKRLLRVMLLGLPVIAAISLADSIFTIKIGLYKKFSAEDYIFIAGLNIMCSLIIVGIYEGLYYIKNWKVLVAETEEIKKINLTNQFQLLKEQVKPHFLFNSLNTLISLIHAQPERAIRFAEELSTVYRYLLRKNLRELSTVREELQFIQLYVSMLQTRFQTALVVNISVAEEDEDALLPPFVLQLLVENAVKHNVVASNLPLTINIQSNGSSIMVCNNLQRKTQSEPSEQTGLLNLIERYKLLKKDDLLEIYEDGSVFRVTLPLMRNRVLEAAV